MADSSQQHKRYTHQAGQDFEHTKNKEGEIPKQAINITICTDHRFSIATDNNLKKDDR